MAGLLLVSVACARPLGPGDRIRIACEESPAICVDRPVSTDGIVSIPGIGGLVVAGHELVNVEADIRALLRKSGVPNPHVQVLLLPSSGRPVEVFGQVSSPGELPIAKGMTLAQVLAVAQPSSGADLEHIQIESSSGAIQLFDSTSGDIELRSGDRVTVPVLTTPNDILVLGGVTRPGAVPFKKSLTLGDCLRAVGGLSGHGDPTAIAVQRGKTRVALRSPADSSFEIRRGDVIRVGLTPEMSYVPVSGAVVHPGAVAFHKGMTLTQIIDATGGLVSRGFSVEIIVKTVRGRGDTRKFDWAAIKSGQIGDPLISQNDAIEVVLK